MQEEDECEEPPSKLASIRKAFEGRSISVDERITEQRKEQIRNEQAIHEEEKENVEVAMNEKFLYYLFNYEIKLVKYHCSLIICLFKLSENLDINPFMLNFA